MLRLIQTHTLKDIPGISSIAWTREGLYLLADNVPELFCLDPATLRIRSRIGLDPQGRTGVMEKKFKPDFEASTLLTLDGKAKLLGFGSGSVAGTREFGFSFDLETGEVGRESLAGLYAQIGSQAGVEINLEGAATFGTKVILANRGHIGQPTNHLAWIDMSKGMDGRLERLQQLDLPRDPFVGVSALEYEAGRDRLWLTASTEETASVYDDGEIGESYLGWIDGFSKRTGQDVLAPDHLIPLTSIDKVFEGQKIEAVAIEGERIFLGADNDGGSATLFVLTLAKGRPDTRGAADPAVGQGAWPGMMMLAGMLLRALRNRLAKPVPAVLS